MWKANVRKMLNKDVQGPCNLSYHASKHSWGLTDRRKRLVTIFSQLIKHEPDWEVCSAHRRSPVRISSDARKGITLMFIQNKTNLIATSFINFILP